MNTWLYILGGFFALLAMYLQANAYENLDSCPGLIPDASHQKFTESLISPIHLWKVDNLSLIKGQTFTIYVESSPSVGDSWNVTSDQYHISLLSQNFKSTSIEQPPPPGSGGILYFTFQGENVGNSTLKFENNFRGQFIKDTKLISVSVTC